MIVTEGKLADALRSATAYKKRLKAEKARLDQDHARLNEEMGAAKARCALLEAEVQQLKEQAGLRMKDLQDSDKMLKAGDEHYYAELNVNQSSVTAHGKQQHVACIAAIESTISESQSVSARGVDSPEPIEALETEDEVDDFTRDLHSDAALFELIDEVELYELRRLEALKLVVDEDGTPEPEDPAEPIQKTAPRSAPEEANTTKLTSESALATAEARISQLEVELQTTRIELSRELAIISSRSAEWSKAFNPSPRDTPRILEDVAHLPREGILAELERVCDLRQEAVFIAELRKDQLERGSREAEQAAIEVAELKASASWLSLLKVNNASAQLRTPSSDVLIC